MHRAAVPPETGAELWKGLDEASLQLSQELDPTRSKCWQLPCQMGCPDAVPCSPAPATPLLWSVARHHIRAMLKFLGWLGADRGSEEPKPGRIWPSLNLRRSGKGQHLLLLSYLPLTCWHMGPVTDSSTAIPTIVLGHRALVALLHIRHGIWDFFPWSQLHLRWSRRAALIQVMPEQSKYPGVSPSQWLLSPTDSLHYMTPRSRSHLTMLIEAGNLSREQLWQPTLQLSQPRGNH